MVDGVFGSSVGFRYKLASYFNFVVNHFAVYIFCSQETERQHGKGGLLCLMWVCLKASSLLKAFISALGCQLQSVSEFYSEIHIQYS